MTNTPEPGHGVVSQPLGRERMLLVGPPQRQTVDAKGNADRTLAELPLILTTRPNSLRLIVGGRLGAHGLQPNVRFEANTLPLMTDLVRAGLGYTVLPACGVSTC